MIAAGFGEGYNGPLIVTVDITQTTDIFEDLDAIGARLAQVDGVAYVGDGLPNETVDTAIIQVVPDSAPTDPETKQVVQDIRDLEDEIVDEFGTPIAVTGYTAVSIDISQRLTDALIPFALIVVGLSIILLLIVFRSVFVPIKAALGFLLSAFGAIGVTVAVFQWGWLADLMHVEPGPILSFLPILLMAVLFGLAMDYEVFLVSGMREEYVKTKEPRSSIVHGFQHAARVVTAAALIMFFVFFAFVPEGTGVIKGIAFALAIGVAFDAFLVRMTLVPAAMALAGRGAWWLPKWLARILPDVDIEGEGLRAHLAESEWAAARDADVLAEDLLVGDPAEPIGPLSIELPRGGALVVRGRPAERRMLAATLAGRVLPAGGRLAVLGLPLPTDAGAVMQRVAITDGTADGAAAGTAGELIAARIDATRAWYRLDSTRSATDAALRRVAEARTASADPLALRTRAIDPDTPVDELDPLDRLLVSVAAALAERPRAVVVDLDGAGGDRAWPALARLVPAGVVLVATAPAGADLAPARAALDGRGIRSLDLVTRPLEARR
ncbi:MMPL family transporter [Agromyces flavus]